MLKNNAINNMKLMNHNFEQKSVVANNKLTFAIHGILKCNNLVLGYRGMRNMLMRISLLLIVCATFISNSLFAQITIQIRQSNPYNFTSKDAWNIDVVNPTQIAIKVYAQASISLNNKKVVELQSLPTEIKPGMNNFTPVVLGTKTINYLDNNLLEIENISGSLPAGNYTVCILFKCLTSDCSGAGSDAVSSELATCENFHKINSLTNFVIK